MKIQCDVCTSNQASVYCTADEAALCDGCDRRVHHANKLASKHQRFSLLLPSSKQVPICDVCQERRAFLFCQQDRAILCRECDLPIHVANEHTLKHDRFLLTGVKLSATSAVYAPVIDGSGSVSVPDPKPPPPPPAIEKSVSVSPAIVNPPSVPKISGQESFVPVDGGHRPTSSISEYLIEMLPGWHVEDFLDSASVSFGLSENDENVLSFPDVDFESNLNSGIWVPQTQAPPSPPPQTGGGNQQMWLKQSKEASAAIKAARTWSDDGFTVPQISPPSIGSKRSRTFW